MLYTQRAAVRWVALPVLVTASVVAAVCAPVALATIYSGGTRSFSAGPVRYDDAAWTGVKATMVVRAGSMSTSDWNSGGFIGERVKIQHTDWDDQNVFVSVGFIRMKVNGLSACHPFWDECYIPDPYEPPDYFMHHCYNYAVTAGTGYEFKGLLVSPYSWRMYLAGKTMQDEFGNDTAQSYPFGTSNKFRVTLWSNCSTARMGTVSDPVEVTQMRKTSGGSWSIGPSESYVNYEVNSSEPRMRGAWASAGSSLSNRRNDN